MNITLNINPELVERGVKALESIARCLDYLVPPEYSLALDIKPPEDGLFVQTDENLRQIEEEERLEREGYDPKGDDDGQTNTL